MRAPPPPQRSALPLHIATAGLFDAPGRARVRKRNIRALRLSGGKREPGKDALRPLDHFQAPTAIEADMFRAPLPRAVEPAVELEELRWYAAGYPFDGALAPRPRPQVPPAPTKRLY